MVYSKVETFVQNVRLATFVYRIAFKKYVEENGILHRTSVPFYPSSNGQIEHFIQIVKKALSAMVNEPGYLQAVFLQLTNGSAGKGIKLQYWLPD